MPAGQVTAQKCWPSKRAEPYWLLLPGSWGWRKLWSRNGGFGGLLSLQEDGVRPGRLCQGGSYEI